MKRTLLWGSATGALLLLGFCAPRWLWGPRVDAMEMRRRDLVQTLVVNGRVLAPRVVQIGVQLTGIVARRLVDEGARVEPGQLLLELDGREARASLSRPGPGSPRCARSGSRRAVRRWPRPR